jgi:hypothetical protein
MFKTYEESPKMLLKGTKATTTKGKISQYFCIDDSVSHKC